MKKRIIFLLSAIIASGFFISACGDDGNGASECSIDKPCADPMKECKGGKCVLKKNGSECSDTKACSDSGKVCHDGWCLDKLPETWIGKECKCKGDCEINLGFAKLQNLYSDKIEGCEAGKADEKDGGKVICLTDFNSTGVGMNTKLDVPNGYCTLAASKFEMGGGLLDMLNLGELLKGFNGGDAEKFKQCPVGAVYVGTIVKKTSDGKGVGIGIDGKIKACYKECYSEKDCRVSEGYKCVSLPDVKDSDGISYEKPDASKKVCVPDKFFDSFFNSKKK